MGKCKVWKRYVAFLLALLIMFMNLAANTETLQAAQKQIKSVSLKIDARDVTKKTVTMYCGDKKTLKAAVSPQNVKKKVTYASNKKNIASVSDKGVISAKKAGTAQIKVTVTAKSNKKKSVYVNVKVKNVSLSLNKKTASLQVGKSLQLQVKVSPQKTVKWSSSDTKVATVSSKGLVKAKKAGTAKITARVGSRAVVCKVTVKVGEKGIRFKDSSVTVAWGAWLGDFDLASLLQLDGVKWREKPKISFDSDSAFIGLYPDYGLEEKIEITSSNHDVIDVNTWESSFSIELRNPGVAVITAKLNGKTTKCKVTVTDPKIDSEDVKKIVGGTHKLSVQGTTSKVTWKSENKAIAKVDSKGNVTAVGIGTTYIDAIVDKKTLRCAFTTEIVPQFLNTYKIQIGRTYFDGATGSDSMVVLADTVLRTTQAGKLDTATDETGKTVTNYNWENIGDITTIDYSAGNVYPVFELEKGKEGEDDYYKTEIYLVGSSQNAVIRRLDTTIDGGKDVYWDYAVGEEMGTITIYSRDPSPALYSVTVDGHVLVFATDCREFGFKKPTDKPENDRETADYVRANASTFNLDTSGVMASIAKYVVDKVIETAVTALINKIFPW